ncbi:MAG TPA: alanine racemase [Gemmatimonadaceae bacterium]
MEETLIYPLPNRAWIDVNVNALRRNAMALMQRTGLPLIPMIKADAYGVGTEGVVRALEPLDPVAYGVASVEEGEFLRRLKITRPVIVFTPILEADYLRAQGADLTPSLGDAASIRAWGPSGKPYQLAIDTGMNRAGLPWRDVADVRDQIRQWPPAGAFTHFHSAELENGSAEAQVERFFDAIDAIGVDIPFLHADNSAAAARGVDGHGRWGAVRPGLFLYGVGATTGIQPESVVSLRARVVDLRWVEAGDTVSYDATYTARRRERIATATIGYGDGYPRALSDRATAMVNGVRVPQRGLVTMDMTMFDVTEVPCEIGDVVTLFGETGGPELTVQGVARSAGMSPYELLTGLAPRLQRRFNEV